MAREMQLSRGYTTLVDDADYKRVSAFKWTYDGHGYAARNTTLSRGKRKMVMLHRFILDAPAGYDVDHINKDGLDNRRSNLRIATRSQNIANSGPKPGSASKFKGVFLETRKSGVVVWRARIRINNKQTGLGLFTNEDDAGRAYDVAACIAWGKFAYLNFPGEMAQQVSAARS